MKTLSISLIFLLLTSVDHTIRHEPDSHSFPFPKIKHDQLASLLEGNWAYDYSFNHTVVFETDGSYFSSVAYVPYRLEFKKSSKKTNKKIQEEHPWLQKHREASCLGELEFWVDDKGIMRYPHLVTKETDSEGYLLSCRLELYTSIYPDREADYITINSVSKGIMLISSYQEGVEDDFHVFVREQVK